MVLSLPHRRANSTAADAAAVDIDSDFDDDDDDEFIGGLFLFWLLRIENDVL